ncbi:translocation/assembly module TamB domain-containing protein [Desulfosarcina sp.]|uniref:translocation/assembly module TamB domain-containing protein n=1 Tax=Desulfosarcina sp. TaxID=2027861 RepID=UPI003970563F
MRPMLLVVAALLAVMFMTVCGLLFWIESKPGRQWVQTRLNAALPGRITIENLRLSLLKPGLDLYGVVLHDPRGLALAGFGRLSAELSFWALWDREIRLNTILLEAPWTDLAMDETDGLNLMNALVPPAREKETQAPAPGMAGLPVNIVFESIRLVDGRFEFKPPNGSPRIEASGINLTADGNLTDRSGNLALTISAVRFSSPGIQPPPVRIALKARLDGDQLYLDRFDATTDRTTVGLSGSAANLYTTPMLDGVLSIDGQLSELNTIVNLAGNYDGPVQAKLTLKGTLANPDADLNLSLENGQIAGQPLDHGALSIRLRDRQATIDTAAIQLAAGTVELSGTINLREAFPKGFLVRPSDVDAITYALTLVQKIPDLNPWLHPFIDIRGKMTSRVSIAGSGVIPSGASARLTLKGSGQELLAAGMDRPIAADIDLSAQMDRGTITLSGFNGAADGVEVSGQGRFHVRDRTLSGKLALTAKDLSRALAVVGIQRVTGACSAQLSVGGSLNQPQFTLSAASRNLKVDRYTLGNLTIDAHMDPDGLLTLNTLHLENKDSRMRGHGRLRLLADGGGIDTRFVNALDLTLEKLSAADFMDFPPIRGDLDGRLQLDGPLESLTGKLSLSGTSLSTAAAAFGDINARIRLESGTVIVDRLDLRNQGSTINASGNIQLLNPNDLGLIQNPQFDFSVDSRHVDPNDFIGSASGDFNFSARLTGSVENPVGRIGISGRQASVFDQPMETVALDARFEAHRLWLDRFSAAVAPGEQIEGAGWVGLDKTFDLKVKSDGIFVSRIHRLRDVFPGEGRLRFDFSGQGSLQNPDIDGGLTVSDILINDGTIEDVHLKFSLHDMLATATGKLNFDMDAACDLKKGDFEAHLTFDRTETAPYFKAAGKPDFHGKLSGKVQAAGNIHDLAHASAYVDLNALHLRFKDISLIQSDRIALKLVDRQLSVVQVEMGVLSSGSLDLAGDARLGGRLNLEINGRVPISAAEVFNADLGESSGTLALTGTVSGDMANPKIDGRIDLEQIGMAVPGLAQKLHDLNGRIYLTADHIRIEGLKGFLDTGFFEIDGSVDHKNLAPTGMNLAIGAQSLPLEVPDTLAVLLNGDINITGTGRRADARGAIVILEGTYYKDVKINLLQMATTRQRALAPATESLSIPYFDTVDLDITVGHRQPFMVQNNLAQLEISPDLKIGGNLENIILSGRAQVKSGTVTFQKKSFDVRKGIIDFVNPYKTEAEIDIESETAIRNWTITLAIKGTPDNLNLKLSSVPTESDADILSLILFGRTAQELTAGGGGAGRSSGQILAEMLADTFGDDIKKTTGVDILQMESNGSSDGEDASGVTVTIGKNLSDRMTVKYAVATKDGEIIQRAITEYKLLENVLVSGFQDSQGIYGSELMFRIEFR